jgi:SAM-dependent methyltransferase
MRPDVVKRLVTLNQTFYKQFAGSFADSRARPQPGFTSLLQELPDGPISVLDVGCGDGRFGRFLYKEIERLEIGPFAFSQGKDWGTRAEIQRYVGVDFSESLLAIARKSGPGEYQQRDLLRPGCLAGLGQFDVIACLATLHHIPGYANRLQLVREIREHLKPDGRLFLSTWQFLDSERQRRKLRDWALIGLNAADVETSDYLLSWERGGQGLRYVALIDEATVKQMAQEAGLTIAKQFYSDGREGNLSLYAVLRDRG